MELPGKFMAKMLYGWDDGKFEEKYLKKLEKNWKKWKEDRQIDKSEHLKMIEEKMEKENKKIRRRDWTTGHFSGGEILKEGVISRSKKIDLFYFIFPFIFLFFFSIYFSIFNF